MGWSKLTPQRLLKNRYFSGAMDGDFAVEDEVWDAAQAEVLGFL